MLQELIKAIRQLLINNVKDPRTDSVPSSRKWIQPDYPRIDATYPRISILHSGTDRREAGIGENKAVYEITLDIDVWVRIGESFTITEDSTQRDISGNELREWLSDQIITTIEKNRSSFCSSYNCLDLYITGIRSLPFDPETRLLRKTISLLIIKVETF